MERYMLGVARHNGLTRRHRCLVQTRSDFARRGFLWKHYWRDATALDPSARRGCSSGGTFGCDSAGAPFLVPQVLLLLRTARKCQCVPNWHSCVGVVVWRHDSRKDYCACLKILWCKFRWLIWQSLVWRRQRTSIMLILHLFAFLDKEAGTKLQ